MSSGDPFWSWAFWEKPLQGGIQVAIVWVVASSIFSLRKYATKDRIWRWFMSKPVLITDCVIQGVFIVIAGFYIAGRRLHPQVTLHQEILVGQVYFVAVLGIRTNFSIAKLFDKIVGMEHLERLKQSGTDGFQALSEFLSHPKSSTATKVRCYTWIAIIIGGYFAVAF